MTFIYRLRCSLQINTLRPRQNGRHFTDDIFKCIFLNENVQIPIGISLKFVPNCLINNNPALVQIMAWRRPGDKPLYEPVMVSLPKHICVIRPQWVNTLNFEQNGRYVAVVILKWNLSIPYKQNAMIRYWICWITFEFRIKCNWNLFFSVQLTIIQHWFW